MNWKEKLHEIIFEAETPSGRAFDLALLVLILLSVAAVLLESIYTIRNTYGAELRFVEWCFTIIFSVEYVLRLITVRKPWNYAKSFFGVVDLLAILPTYLSLLVVGAQSLLIIRALRLLRVFRIFKLVQYVGESKILLEALQASKVKIIIFLGAVTCLVLILGSLMYLVEGSTYGFTSIPKSVYWAIVTMTTVGYGDISPQTPLGQFLASIIMILGYAIIAIPTGIFSVEMAHAERKRANTITCASCSQEGHARDAKFCRICGDPL